MPTGRARFRLVKAGRSSGTPTHTVATVASTCKPVTHTSHLFISAVLFCILLCISHSLWCRSRGLQEGGDPAQMRVIMQEGEQGSKDEWRYRCCPPSKGSADVASEQIPSFHSSCSSNLPVSSVVAFFALSDVSVCSHAVTPPPFFHRSLFFSLPLSLSLSLRRREQKMETLLAMNGGTTSAPPPPLSLRCTVCSLPQPHSLLSKQEGVFTPHTHTICGSCFIMAYG